MPSCIVPDEKQGALAFGGEEGGQPSEKGTGDGTQRAAIDKAQQHLIVAGQVEAITGYGGAIRIILGPLLLDQM